MAGDVKKPRRATLRELSEAAQTSVSTASLVMNGTWERHRINAGTAERVRTAAERIGYAPNQRARALRLERSSLAGMILPHHRNRFFAGLAENFEAQARQRGLVPIVVSTQRDPDTERQVAETLIGQEVELLVVAGVYDPSTINRLCRERGVRCVNVDLPGPESFSVVTDNRGGAHALTRRLIGGLSAEASVMFLGGREGEYATELRVEGFEQALCETGRRPDPARILRCGYHPAAARDALDALAQRRHGFPDALLVNSITAFEGFATYWRDRPECVRDARLACFDWDPFAACLPVETIMLRQDVEGLIRECFVWFDEGEDRAGEVAMVSPRLAVDDLTGESAEG